MDRRCGSGSPKRPLAAQDDIVETWDALREGRPVGVLTRPMYGTSIALLTVVRSGQAGGIKGAEASLTDETLATMSPFALVRRGVGWWSCGDSNPGPSHCEGVSSPIDHPVSYTHLTLPTN